MLHRRVEASLTLGDLDTGLGLVVEGSDGLGDVLVTAKLVSHASHKGCNNRWSTHATQSSRTFLPAVISGTNFLRTAARA